MNAPPTLYAARCGRRRSFLSPGDATAYTRGWDRYPAACTGPAGTPESTGWTDAMAEKDQRDEDRDNARDEAAELEGEW